MIAAALALALAAAPPAPARPERGAAERPGAEGRAEPCAPAWPQWDRYAAAFVSGDGRVIDRTGGDRTTSEGQAYAMFFALVAGDRPRFERLLRWTEDNLAAGSLERTLPAWNWGRDREGRWNVLDENSASDADLWMGYALLEAGRLWREPRHDALGRALLARAAEREVADLPGLGPTLLPAPRGFADARGWRLNPSYGPPQLLRALESAGAPGPWGAVRASAVRVLRAATERGAAPDWILWSRARRAFARDPVHGWSGSYDAIRVYLWLGLLPPDDPLRAELAPRAGALLSALAARGEVPERIDARSLHGRGRAPVGFYAALWPLAAGSDVEPAVARRVAGAERAGLYGDPPAYYDQNLALFARGFLERRYAFAADGRLRVAWEDACATSSSRSSR